MHVFDVLMKIPNDFLHAAFFFVDIVGLSNPVLSTETQKTKIKKLNELIYDCTTFNSFSQEDLFILPTGDGMLICFKKGLEEPIKLAIELHKKLAQYNATVPKTENISIRIGCHIGHVFIVKDVYDHLNLWGPGAIMARRVMDVGDENHILLTSTMANDLLELSNQYRNILHPLHDYQIKHGGDLLIYSVYDKSFGNPNKPQKGLIEQTQRTEKISKKTNKIQYDKIEMMVSLKNIQKNQIKISKTYWFSNIVDEPIDEVMCDISIDTIKTFAELKIGIFDENKDPLEFGRISMDSDYQKKFSIKFQNHILKGDKDREFTITYETEQKNQFFENFLFENTNCFMVKFNFPSNASELNPKLSFLSYQNREKILPAQIDVKTGVITVMTWEPINNLKKNDMIRLDW